MSKNKFIHHIGVDLLGSETKEKDFFSSLLFLTEERKDIFFIVFGTKNLLKIFDKDLYENISFFLVEEVITMEDSPLRAIKQKKKSSLCEGINLLRDKKIDAFVSCGNTGALMTYAKLQLPMLPFISRPALLALLPTKKHPLAVIDVGANVTASFRILFEFALLGIAFQKNRGISQPLLGLLNIGEEAQKGTLEMKKAYDYFTMMEKQLVNIFHFQGNIEGKKVFQGNIDVLITDGFTGNIFLKTSEGLANLVLDKLQENIPTKDLSSFQFILDDLKKCLHYEKYPGALLCGVEGIIVKCHNYSSSSAFLSGIKGAIHFCENNLISFMKKFLEKAKF